LADNSVANSQDSESLQVTDIGELDDADENAMLVATPNDLQH